MKTTILLAIGCFTLVTAQAQDLRNVQSFSNIIDYNPALMGSNTYFRTNLTYRNQWKSIQKGYSSYGISIFSPILSKENSKIDIGVNVLKYQMGAFNNINTSLALGYTLKMNKSNAFSVALNGGYYQNSIDIPNMTFDSQYSYGSFNASNATNETLLQNRNKGADVGFGLLWFTHNQESNSKLDGYFGISGKHMNSPNSSFNGSNYTMLSKYSVQGGIIIHNEGNLDVSFNSYYSKQGTFEEFGLGTYVDYYINDDSKIILGSWIRNTYGVSALVGFDHKNFSVGYSYDIMRKSVNNSISGLLAHEVSLAFKFNRDKNLNLKDAQIIRAF